jgi:signal transduction histidine kinase
VILRYRFFPKGKLLWPLEAAFALAALIALIVLARASRGTHAPLPYLYGDTKQLVFLVQDAAHLIEKEGTAAFSKFRVPGSRWLGNQHYLFIYNLDGVCLFHPAEPGLVGRHLLDLKDINGKPIGRWVIEIGRRPEPHASGWVFYLWEAPGDLNPTWKVSYICKAVGPDGKVYLVGSGMQNFKIEPIFVKNCVTRAVTLLQQRGEKIAFAQFRDPASRFSFCDTYTYVLDTRGRCLVDPGFPSLGSRDLEQFRDALGHYPVREALQRLQLEDNIWVQYMLPRPGSTLPSRKLAYVRKVKINGEELVVWADFFLATPIWMR